MNTPDTVYSGRRLMGGRGEVLGVEVTSNNGPMVRRLTGGGSGFEWGYGGAGPLALSRALVADATGDAHLAERVGVWFMWAVVNCWCGDTWSITAAAVRGWVAQWEEETRAEDGTRVVVIADQATQFEPAEGGAP